MLLAARFQSSFYRFNYLNQRNRKQRTNNKKNWIHEFALKNPKTSDRANAVTQKHRIAYGNQLIADSYSAALNSFRFVLNAHIGAPSSVIDIRSQSQLLMKSIWSWAQQIFKWTLMQWPMKIDLDVMNVVHIFELMQLISCVQKLWTWELKHLMDIAQKCMSNTAFCCRNRDGNFSLLSLRIKVFQR